MSLDQITAKPLNVVLAVVVVDLIAMILARNGLAGNVINEWYDKFGLGAYVSDVGSICFGIFLSLALFKYVLPKGSFAPVNFIASVVLIQMAHDLLFAAVIRAYRKGSNRMMDMFKKYVNENGWKILLVDASMMIGSVLLIYLLLPVDNVWVYAMLAFALYFSQFLIYS
jgi:hypothetical protein